MEKSNRAFSWGAWAGAALIAAVVLLLAGCFSFGSAIGGAIGRSAAPQPAPSAQAQPAGSDQTPPAPSAPQNQAAPSAGATMAYQYQFNAFYSGFWSMGWFGYKDGNYKPGQGTVWKFINTGRTTEPVTFERALLKVNDDGSQWWRFRVDSGKKTIMYEFLVGSDMVAKKVRYKDPDSGAVGEFIPSQDNSMPAQGPSNMPKSRADMAKYKVDSQNVTVQAGSFATEHYLYTDDASKGSAESWINEKVPGYMVKSVYTSKKNNQASQGELIQIESGVTTSLGSY